MAKSTKTTSAGVSIAMLVAAGLAIGALAAVAVIPGVAERIFSTGGGRAPGQALVGGPFSLIDQNGRRVTDQDYRGKLMLIFFGFTHCPDVCPTSLQLIAGALDKLGAKAQRVVPVFVTVDPERDTPEVMKDYVATFDPRIMGLTGTPDEVQTAVKAYRVYARKVPDESSPGQYTMDHTAILYLMGPDGRFITHFTHGSSVEAMTAAIEKAL
jgi:protein SCO1/2